MLGIPLIDIDNSSRLNLKFCIDRRMDNIKKK